MLAHSVNSKIISSLNLIRELRGHSLHLELVGERILGTAKITGQVTRKREIKEKGRSWNEEVKVPIWHNTRVRWRLICCGPVTSKETFQEDKRFYCEETLSQHEVSNMKPHKFRVFRQQ
ncbi:hypothetical protein M8J75_014369 [Diaphorina citri]|nr:hypothetical protein M8J75_014369 [Diaphorina citri]